MKRRNRLRVLMTTDAVGGVWTYATDLSASLAAEGVDVILALLGETSPSFHGRPSPHIRLVETGLPLDWLADDGLTLARAGRALADMAKDCGADLVHLNSPALAADAGFAVPVVGACHSCVATWWDAVRAGPLPEDFRWRTSVLEQGYAACDALIAPSFSFVQDTLARYGFAPRGVRNGRAPGDRRFDPQRKRPYVLTSGRLWDEGKNIAALDAAAAAMRGEVLAAGPLSGPHGQTVSLQAVRPLGVLGTADLTERLNDAAVFASLALYEPFGLGVLEAAQAGCALVLADIPTFRELWSGAAVFVAPHDAKTVAAVLDGLLDDPAEAARLGDLAAARAATFSVGAMVKNTLAVYREVLANGRLKGAAA